MRRSVLFTTLCVAAIQASATLGTLRADLLHLAGDNKVGIAVITCYGDTVEVNGDRLFDMASVAKFHQAVALAKTLSFDEMAQTEIRIAPASLEKNTWSPMRAAAGSDEFTLTPAGLLDYTLMMSDNNAADILFNRYNSPSATDSILHRCGYPGRYRISYTEKEMHADSTCAVNVSTPLAAAAAINRFFASDTTASATLVKAIMSRDTPFGKERILAGLQGKNAKVFHKTGTGFNNPSGTPKAINDIAFVSYKTNSGYRCYSIAVFLEDFEGSRADGEKLIADISSAVWNAVIVEEVNQMNACAQVPTNRRHRVTKEEGPGAMASIIGAIADCIIDNALGIDE